MPLEQFRSSTASLREVFNDWNVAGSVEWRQAWMKGKEGEKGKEEGGGGREAENDSIPFYLAHNSSQLTPQPPPLTPHPSALTPHPSPPTPQPSALTPHPSPLTPHSPVTLSTALLQWPAPADVLSLAVDCPVSSCPAVGGVRHIQSGGR